MMAYVWCSSTQTQALGLATENMLLLAKMITDAIAYAKPMLITSTSY